MQKKSQRYFFLVNLMLVNHAKMIRSGARPDADCKNVCRKMNYGARIKLGWSYFRDAKIWLRKIESTDYLRQESGVLDFSMKVRKQVLCISFSLLVLLTTFSVHANDFDEAVRAYEERRYLIALDAFKALGAKGDRRAQTFAGTILDEGLGVKENNSAAFRWFELAAVQGYADAQYLLGVMHLAGEVDQPNALTALQLFWLAAQKNHPESQAMLGAAFLEGKGTEQNFSEALYWLNLAAEQNEARAQKILGDIYLAGEGVDKDLERAREKYLLASASGLESALAALAQMDRGYVTEIQKQLRQLRYYGSVIDGSFGEGTRGAVSRFSSDVGLNLATEDKRKLFEEISRRVSSATDQCETMQGKYVACFRVQ